MKFEAGSVKAFPGDRVYVDLAAANLNVRHRAVTANEILNTPVAICFRQPDCRSAHASEGCVCIPR